MSLEDLSAEAAWLYELTGCKCPWPIETEHDLREWAINVAGDTENLTGAEVDRVRDLIERLGPPEERRLAELNRQQMKERVKAWFGWTFERGKKLSGTGAAANKQRGAETRAEVVRIWKSLDGTPLRDRAALVAKRVSVTERHVRRVLREEGLK